MVYDSLSSRKSILSPSALNEEDQPLFKRSAYTQRVHVEDMLPTREVPVKKKSSSKQPNYVEFVYDQMKDKKLSKSGSRRGSKIIDSNWTESQSVLSPDRKSPIQIRRRNDEKGPVPKISLDSNRSVSNLRLGCKSTAADSATERQSSAMMYNSKQSYIPEDYRGDSQERSYSTCKSGYENKYHQAQNRIKNFNEREKSQTQAFSKKRSTNEEDTMLGTINDKMSSLGNMVRVLEENEGDINNFKNQIYSAVMDIQNRLQDMTVLYQNSERKTPIREEDQDDMQKIRKEVEVIKHELQRHKEAYKIEKYKHNELKSQSERYKQYNSELLV